MKEGGTPHESARSGPGWPAVVTSSRGGGPSRFPTTSILVVTGSLLDRSAISPLPEVTCLSPDDLRRRVAAGAAATDWVVVDLARDDALALLAECRDAGVRTAAYGPHADRDRLRAAQALGARTAPRSQIFAVADRAGALAALTSPESELTSPESEGKVPSQGQTERGTKDERDDGPERDRE